MRDNPRDMSGQWLPYTILRASSLVVPYDQRTEWVAEWRSELWYIPRHRSTLFCLGAFRDAFCLRRNLAELEHLGAAKRARSPLQSPLTCLAFLATFAALSILIALHLTSLSQPPPLPLRAGNLPGQCAATLLFSCLLLP